MVVAAAAVLPFVPGAAHLGFVPLPPAIYGAIAVVAVLYLVVVEATKRIFYSRARS